MRKLATIVFLLMLLIVGCKQVEQTDSASETAETSAEAAVDGNLIKVKMRMYEFDPDPIMMKAGEKYIIELTAVDVPHGFLVPDLGVNVRVTPGEVKRVSVIPQEAGTYEVKCHVYCGEGHSNMKGTIIVE
ncbi:MAG TPA: cupredoxin domain-containing protein [Candidatus Nanoarchaeia archaeon]|nr:cupredoxin domain-containing protein [Candidatus Nanoarchaeia archaeon]